MANVGRHSFNFGPNLTDVCQTWTNFVLIWPMPTTIGKLWAAFDQTQTDLDQIRDDFDRWADFDRILAEFGQLEIDCRLRPGLERLRTHLCRKPNSELGQIRAALDPGRGRMMGPHSFLHNVA